MKGTSTHKTEETSIKIRDPFNLIKFSKKIVPAMGHDFGPDLFCHCGEEWQHHQSKAKVCPKQRQSVKEWMVNPSEATVRRWAAAENSKLKSRADHLNARSKILDSRQYQLDAQEAEQAEKTKGRKSLTAKA